MKIQLENVDGFALPEGCFMTVRTSGAVKYGAHEDQQVYEFADAQCRQNAQIDIYQVVYQHIGLCNIPVETDAISVHEVMVKAIDPSQAAMKLKVSVLPDSRQTGLERDETRGLKIQGYESEHEEFNVEEPDWLKADWVQCKTSLVDRCTSTSNLEPVWGVVAGDDSTGGQQTSKTPKFGDQYIEQPIRCTSVDTPKFGDQNIGSCGDDSTGEQQSSDNCIGSGKTPLTDEWSCSDYQRDAALIYNTLHELERQPAVEKCPGRADRDPSKQSSGSQLSSGVQRDRTTTKETVLHSEGSQWERQSTGESSKTLVRKTHIMAQPSMMDHGAPVCTADGRRLAVVGHEEEMLKEKVRQAINKSPYNVKDFYKTRGVWQLIARSSWFELLTLIVITLNAVWIAVDTDMNEAEMLVNADWGFQFAENAFCAYFAFEWLVRYMSFRRTRDSLRDPWFLFDSCLLISMVLETWVLSAILLLSWGDLASNANVSSILILRMVRLLRLSRMARIARLCRKLPELVILVKGMIESTRSVATTLALLAICLYIFGIAFTQLCKNTTVGSERFPTVSQSMYRLLLYGVLCLDYVDDYAQSLADVHFVIAALYFVFILLSAFTVMNMLIGVLCEVVTRTAKVEKMQASEGLIREKMLEILNGLDKNGNHLISKQEFARLMECSTEVCVVLSELGIDVINMLDYADIIFESPDSSQEIELSFEDFIEIVLQLRGDTISTVRDVVELRRSFQFVGADTNFQVEQLAKKVAGLTATIDNACADQLERKSQGRERVETDGSSEVVASDAQGLANEMRPSSRSSSKSSVSNCSIISDSDSSTHSI